MRGHTTAARNELTTDVLRNSSGAIEAEEQGSLQLALGALNLHIRGVDRHTRPLTEREVAHVIHVLEVLGDEVDAPETSIRVAGRERHEAVREAVGGDDVGQAGRHKASGTK